MPNAETHSHAYKLLFYGGGTIEYPKLQTHSEF